MNISALKILLKENGSRLAHQTLDGMNWKQVTYNDIYSNIEYINSYLTKNKIINRKVLSLTANCIDSYVLECSLINLGCSLNFASKSRLLDVQFNLDFDIILVDTIIDINDNHILQNLTKNKIIISIQNFKKTKESGSNSISLQNIYKIGLLSKKETKIDKESKINLSKTISFLESNSIKTYTMEDINNFARKNESTFNIINENEFCASLYLKKDIFSKVLNLLFIKFKNKFTNNNSLNSFIENVNEIMPSNLIIDSVSLKELINICYMNKIGFSEFTGSKIKKIITFELPDNENLELIKKDGIEIISLNS